MGELKHPSSCRTFVLNRGPTLLCIIFQWWCIETDCTTRWKKLILKHRRPFEIPVTGRIHRVQGYLPNVCNEWTNVLNEGDSDFYVKAKYVIWIKLIGVAVATSEKRIGAPVYIAVVFIHTTYYFDFICLYASLLVCMSRPTLSQL